MSSGAKIIGGMNIGRFLILVAALIGQAATAQNQPINPRGRQYPITLLRDQCMEFTEVKLGEKPDDLRDCRVSEFGEFGAIDGQTYYYALYCLIPNYTPDNSKCNDDSTFIAGYYRQLGLAVFVGDSLSGSASLLFERATSDVGTLVYEKPQIIGTVDRTLLYLNIRVDGTGHYNASEYFVRESGAWAPVESEEWLKDLGQRLPAGLEIWKGVWPDLKTMTAVAGLYRSGDANCCPSGGTAQIGLAIESRRFVLKSLAIEKAQ